MKVTVIGSGYVGLVSGACLADVGNHVCCLDVDVEKIRVLSEGGIPIHEPGLDSLVRRNVEAGRLFFTASVEQAAKFGEVQFIAVGTPPDEDGSADLKYVLAAARNIGRYADGDCVVVDKSTVPVGTADLVQAAINEELSTRGASHQIVVVSNPEFLKEGAAIEDFMRPDRIVVGANDEDARSVMRLLYAPFQRNHDKLVFMDVRSAELTKYAANAMLATRISFMNELANLAESLGADIELVRQGIGSDPRIGRHFLYAGCGYGGSCFPKDVKALIEIAKQNKVPMRVLSAVEDANEIQKNVILAKVTARFGQDLKGKRFAVWGLAFKPDTDDMREAPSLVIISALLDRGAEVSAYDPVAMREAERVLGHREGLGFAGRPNSALDNADALIIVTEWKEFRSPDFSEIKARLKNAVIFDGRNMYDPALVRGCGFEYFPIGRN